MHDVFSKKTHDLNSQEADHACNTTILCLARFTETLANSAYTVLEYGV